MTQPKKKVLELSFREIILFRFFFFNQKKNRKIKLFVKVH